MSDTGYIISSGLDLTDIFLPLSSGTSINYDTGFSTLVNSISTDLRYVFASISSGSELGYETGYSVTGKGDLSTIFAKNTSYTTTGNTTITTQNGYTFVQFLSSGTGSITFINPSAGLQISYLVVGGGGAGGSGYYYEEGGSGTTIVQFYTGGGGAGGQVTQGTFSISASTTLTTTIGAGAIASTTTISGGTNSSITYSSTTYTSQGGQGGGLYNSTEPYTTPGGTGINSSGDGGNGGAILYSNGSATEILATSSPSSSYDSSYSNISINGYSLGYAVSGGGGAGYTIPLTPTGSGGTGGYITNAILIAPENGTYGGGGGGYCANISGTTNAGANGGDGLIIVSFFVATDAYNGVFLDVPSGVYTLKTPYSAYGLLFTGYTISIDETDGSHNVAFLYNGGSDSPDPDTNLNNGQWASYVIIYCGDWSNLPYN